MLRLRRWMSDGEKVRQEVSIFHLLHRTLRDVCTLSEAGPSAAGLGKHDRGGKLLLCVCKSFKIYCTRTWLNSEELKWRKPKFWREHFVIRRLKLRNRKSETAGSGRRNIYGRISFDWATIYYKSWINISRPGFGAMVTNWTESGLHWCLSKHS